MIHNRPSFMYWRLFLGAEAPGNQNGPKSIRFYEPAAFFLGAAAPGNKNSPKSIIFVYVLAAIFGSGGAREPKWSNREPRLANLMAHGARQPTARQKFEPPRFPRTRNPIPLSPRAQNREPYGVRQPTTRQEIEPSRSPRTRNLISLLPRAQQS